MLIAWFRLSNPFLVIYLIVTIHKMSAILISLAEFLASLPHFHAGNHFLLQFWKLIRKS